MRLHAMSVSAALVLSLAAGGLTGCKNDRVAQVTDTKTALANDELSTGEKERVVDRIANAAATPQARREALKDVAWTASNGYRTRNYAIDKLVDDPIDPDNADTRNMLALLLGPEPDKGVVEHISKLAGDRGWADLTPSIVRQLAKPGLETKDKDRPEWIAISKMHPGKSVEEVVFEVFAAPEVQGPGHDRAEKARESAWQLLTRLDKDGSKRRGYLAAMAENPSPAMADIRAAASELGTVPLTASELEWLRVLKRPANAEWWKQASSAIAALNETKKQALSMRHAEPIRWATANEPSWVTMDRAQLAGALTDALKGRRMILRSETGGDAGQKSERLADNIEKMTWADLLSLLVLDRAIHTPGLVEKLWAQAQEDKGDTTTEYGGFIGADAGPFKANLYPPRPTQRFSDTRFVASDDLLTSGATGLAVYHFHAQNMSNTEAAGPSGGDIEYARDSGRLCVVFTPIGPNTFDVDAYFGNGTRCDLGAITAAGAASR